MKRRIRILIAVCILGLIAGGVIYSNNSNLIAEAEISDSAERDIMLEGNKVKIINTDNLELSPNYTLHDVVNENTNPEDIKPKTEEKKWWEKEPQNEAEAELFENVKIEKEYLRQLSDIELQIKNAKTEREKQNLENKFERVFELWTKQKDKSIEIMKKHGFYDE